MDLVKGWGNSTGRRAGERGLHGVHEGYSEITPSKYWNLLEVIQPYIEVSLKEINI